jgi:hypothetical protein
MRVIPIMKANEKTSAGRIYTAGAIRLALEKIKHNTRIPIVALDRDKNEKTVAFIGKADIKFDESTLILNVCLDDSVLKFIMGRSLVPYIYVDKVRRGEKDTAIIDFFTINGLQAVDDLCSFPSINSVVK